MKKNEKIINAQKINEYYNAIGNPCEVKITSEVDLSRDDIKDFLKKLR